MTDIIIQGIGGRMGHALCEMIANRSDCCVVAGIDQQDGEQNGIPVYDSLDKLDGKGDVKAMEEGGAKLNGINALLYGAGGISGVTAFELAQSGVKKLYIANRTPEKAEKIARLVNEHTAATAEVIGTDAAALDKAAESCELFANLTPLGMKGFDKKHDYLGFIDRIPKTATVFDCVINPPLSETITAARTAGLNTVPGMRMLVAQMDVIFKFLFNQTVTGADKQACIEELCNYLGVPSNF